MDAAVAKIRDFVRRKTSGEHIWRVGVALTPGVARVTLHSSYKSESLTLERENGKAPIAETLSRQIEQAFGRKAEVTVVQCPVAVAKYVRISPRKCRLVVDAIRYKHVSDALAILQFVPNSASKTVAKLVKSAIANAENNHRMDRESLEIIHVHVDEGPTLKRISPRAQGRVYRIMKRTSHITVGLAETEAEARIGRKGKAVARTVSKTTRRGAKVDSPKAAKPEAKSGRKAKAVKPAKESAAPAAETSAAPETGGGE